MNSIVKVFSNFKDFYNEINGATLTGAIDVIAVEQPDGSYQCSPFHVRFGKLGVLRSREKIVDIEVNGDPVDIHMKLGESGEAFFVEEVSEDDLEILPEHMATSPIPTSEFEKNYDNSASSKDNKDSNSNASTVNTLQIPKPRRNSIDLTSNGDNNSLKVEDAEKATLKYDNQLSDYVVRRHTDMGAIRPDLTATKREYTTQKLREEWQAEQDQLQQIQENLKANEELDENKHFRPIEAEDSTPKAEITIIQQGEGDAPVIISEDKQQDPKMKKKRRKKSVLKKKNQTQRKNSASSGSADMNDPEPDTLSVSISNTTLSSSTDSTPPHSGDVIDVAANDDGVVPQKEPETPSRVRDLDLHFFSDTEVASGMSPRGSRPSTPIQSDTEFEVSQREKNDDSSIMSNSASWKWGELPTQPEEIPGQTKEDAKQAQRNSMLGGMFSFMKQGRKLRKHNPDGIYLEDLENEDIDPEVAALYFPQHQRRVSHAKGIEGKMHGEDDRESGNGTSVPQSPTSMEGLKSLDSDYDEGKHSALDFVAISLCGGLEKGNPNEEEFQKHQLQFADICQDPAIFASPNLVVRLNGKYYSWTVACPIVMTLIIYQKPLPSDVCQQLDKLTKEQKERDAKSSDEEQNAEKAASYSWWNWRRSGSQSASQPPSSAMLQEPRGSQILSKSMPDANLAVATQTSRANTPDDNSLLQISEKSNSNIKQNDSYNASMSSSNDSFDGTKLHDTYMNSSHGTAIEEQISNEKYRKSLRLTSKQIESLNLKTGMNEVVFSVTTAYQGTSRCKCYLFKWKYNDKVVISDIDGTITRSDVLGHILPMVGKDWAQFGVAQLFSKIEQNGYKLLYLSARAIGQSRATREYLRSIRQGNVKLPDGPLLLNPTSLISAFHREVIERKPEQFKIACLSDIQALFPEKCPFYAGYGNRINDVWAYRAVGIPIMRIFTINTKGELKHELTQTFQSSYAGQSLVADDIFPKTRHFDSFCESEDSCFGSNTGNNSDDEGEDDLQFGEFEYEY